MSAQIALTVDEFHALPKDVQALVRTWLEQVAPDDHVMDVEWGDSGTLRLRTISRDRNHVVVLGDEFLRRSMLVPLSSCPPALQAHFEPYDRTRL